MHSYPMPFSFDIELAVVNGLLLTWTWLWALRSGQNSRGFRQKAASVALGCATGAAGFDLIVTVIRHWESIDAPEVYFRSLQLMGAFALLGAVSAIFGMGRPRVAGLVWSLFLLVLCLLEFGVAGH